MLRSILFLNASDNSVTGKKEKKIFLIYKEIQKGSVAKTYITNGLPTYG